MLTELVILNSDHITDRVRSAKRVIMVFERHFMMITNSETINTMSYVGDIVVEDEHQGKAV